jgi:4-hydroxy-2-oxoheptanedioate aldolase
MRNRLKARLGAGETIGAMWLEFGSAEVAEAAVLSGWDVVVIDCEHGAAGLEDGLGLLRAVEAAGGEAILRTPNAEEATLKRALDRGARSLMVPMVNSPAIAAQVAGFCRYPPLGRRGYAASIVRASGWGARPDYGAHAADELLLLAQIEHADAVRDFDAIMATQGVDMGFVGPFDLSGSLGVMAQLDAPEMKAALGAVERKAAASGALIGTIATEGRDWARLKALGYLPADRRSVRLRSAGQRRAGRGAGARRRAGVIRSQRRRWPLA